MSLVEETKYPVNIAANFDSDFVKSISALHMLEKFFRNNPNRFYQINYPINFDLDRFGERIVKLPKIVTINVNGSKEICHKPKLPNQVTLCKSFNKFMNFEVLLCKETALTDCFASR